MYQMNQSPNITNLTIFHIHFMYNNVKMQNSNDFFLSGYNKTNDSPNCKKHNNLHIYHHKKFHTSKHIKSKSTYISLVSSAHRTTNGEQ